MPAKEQPDQWAGTTADDLVLGAADRDRLERLLERRLPHLLDEPERIDWYVAEVMSYWCAQPRKRGRRDWPLTILNRMLRLEMDRFHGRLPNPADVRAEQAERRLAAAAARNAEQPTNRPLAATQRPARVLPREVG